MTRSQVYELIVDAIASLIIVGMWAGLAWVISLFGPMSWDRCFMFVIAISLATRLPGKTS